MEESRKSFRKGIDKVLAKIKKEVNTFVETSEKALGLLPNSEKFEDSVTHIGKSRNVLFYSTP